MVDVLAEWCSRYPIVSLEDGLAEDDWDHWPRLRERLGSAVLVVGDDLLCTNTARVRRAAAAGAANGLLLKVNQVGTLTEAAEAYRAARAAGWQVTVSARSGETEDDWLADLAVGWSGDQIKVGSVTHSERLAKYNRLLAIETRGGAAGGCVAKRRPASESRKIGECLTVKAPSAKLTEQSVGTTPIAKRAAPQRAASSSCAGATLLARRRTVHVPVPV